MAQNWLEALLSGKNRGNPEAERGAILLESGELEAGFAEKKITQEEYDAKNRELHDRLVCADLRAQIAKTSQRIAGIVEAENRKLKLNSARQEFLDEALAQKSATEREVNEALGLYEKKKLRLAEFRELLRQKNSELLDMEEEVKRLYRLQAQGRLRQQEIMLSTAKELEAAKADEIAEDLLIQIPKGENFEFPSMPTEETKHVQRHRHERRRTH